MRISYWSSDVCSSDLSRSRPRNILVFEVSDDGRALGPSRVLFDAADGTPDGFRVDVECNLWCGWGMGTPELDGARVYSPRGELLGRLALPERCANLCFRGKPRTRLFIASCTSIYSLFFNKHGAAVP